MIPLRVNSQAPEQVAERREDGAIEVVSVFYTIQGEGPFTGRPAIFIRLAGCNLKCPHCDTDYTSNRKFVTPDKLVDSVVNALPNYQNFYHSGRNPLVVFTGGEPFRQSFGDSVRALIQWRFNEIQVETNGINYDEDFPYLAVTLVVSPKTGILNPLLRQYTKHLKYVIGVNSGINNENGLPLTALGNNSFLPAPWDGWKGTVWIQPEDSGDEDENKKNRNLAVRIALKYGYRISLQTHKILGVD